MKITAKGAGKDFIRQSAGTNRFTAVRPTDIEIEPGKLTLLMGRSGSGKSTLLNILSGLLPPTTGKVLYGDDDIYSFDDVKLSDFRNRHIGVIPQGQTAIQSLDVIAGGAFRRRTAARGNSKGNDTQAGRDIRRRTYLRSRRREYGAGARTA